MRDVVVLSTQHVTLSYEWGLSYSQPASKVKAKMWCPGHSSMRLVAHVRGVHTLILEFSPNMAWRLNFR